VHLKITPLHPWAAHQAAAPCWAGELVAARRVQDRSPEAACAASVSQCSISPVTWRTAYPSAAVSRASSPEPRAHSF